MSPAAPRPLRCVHAFAVAGFKVDPGDTTFLDLTLTALTGEAYTLRLPLTVRQETTARCGRCARHTRPSHHLIRALG